MILVHLYLLPCLRCAQRKCFWGSDADGKEESPAATTTTTTTTTSTAQHGQKKYQMLGRRSKPELVRKVKMEMLQDFYDAEPALDEVVRVAQALLSRPLLLTSAVSQEEALARILPETRPPITHPASMDINSFHEKFMFSKKMYILGSRKET